MKNTAGMKFDCILEETLDFIDIDYTHLNKTIRYEQRPHGEWEKKPEICYDYFYCSGCGYAYKHAFNFCPKCGSDMREGDENG